MPNLLLAEFCEPEFDLRGLGCRHLRLLVSAKCIRFEYAPDDHLLHTLRTSWGSTLLETITYLVHSYGYFGVAIVIGLESMGVPLPGEAILISASIYAGSTHKLNILGIVLAAIVGAVAGDNIGWMLGREFGTRLLARYGARIGITEPKIKLGRYLFAKWGGWVVFFGRFIAVLRTLAALLAGTNNMPWTRFFVANLAGAAVWACLFGGGAYVLGRQIHGFVGPVGAIAFALVVTAGACAGVLIRRNEARLQAEAEAAYPGPLQRRSIFRRRRLQK